MNGGGFSDIFLYSRTRRLFAARVAIIEGGRLCGEIEQTSVNNPTTPGDDGCLIKLEARR